MTTSDDMYNPRVTVGFDGVDPDHLVWAHNGRTYTGSAPANAIGNHNSWVRELLHRWVRELQRRRVVEVDDGTPHRVYTWSPTALSDRNIKTCPCGAEVPASRSGSYCSDDCTPSPSAPHDHPGGTEARWRPDLVSATEDEDVDLIYAWPVGDGQRTLRVLHHGPRHLRRGEVRLDDGNRFVGVRLRLPEVDLEHVLRVLAFDRLAVLAADLDAPEHAANAMSDTVRRLPVVAAASWRQIGDVLARGGHHTTALASALRDRRTYTLTWSDLIYWTHIYIGRIRLGQASEEMANQLIAHLGEYPDPYCPRCRTGALLLTTRRFSPPLSFYRRRSPGLPRLVDTAYRALRDVDSDVRRDWLA